MANAALHTTPWTWIVLLCLMEQTDKLPRMLVDHVGAWNFMFAEPWCVLCWIVFTRQCSCGSTMLPRFNYLLWFLFGFYLTGSGQSIFVRHSGIRISMALSCWARLNLQTHEHRNSFKSCSVPLLDKRSFECPCILNAGLSFQYLQGWAISCEIAGDFFMVKCMCSRHKRKWTNC